MRQYAAVSPRFWNGPTGKAIRSSGRDAQVLALYLITGPSAHMMGLYYLAFPTLCHEAGFMPEEARATLAVLAGHEFAFYDEAAELVWIPEGAAHQIGDELKPGDKRIAGIERVLQGFLGHPYGRAFLRRYKSAYSLSLNVKGKPLARPSVAPPKPGTGTVTGTETGTGAGEGARPTDDPPPFPHDLERPVGPRNPLVDRETKIREGYALIREIQAITHEDGTEILARCSAWKGLDGRTTRKVDLAGPKVSDNRIANTVIDLKAELAKLRAAAQPKPAAVPIEARIVPVEEAYERRRQERARARNAEGEAGSDPLGVGPRGLVGGRDQSDRPDAPRAPADPPARPEQERALGADEAPGKTSVGDRRQG